MEKRNKEIDIIKGIATLLVLWGHSIQYFSLDNFSFYENWMFRGIYSFHMPLFMIVSGYLFFYSKKRHSFRKLCISRIKSLGGPLIIWGGCYGFITQSVRSIFYHEPISYYNLGKEFFANWFIWSVLIISINVAVIENICDICLKKIIAYALSVIFLSLLPCSENNLFMFPFFVFGYYANKNKMLPRKICWDKRIHLLIPILFIFSLRFYGIEDFVYISGVNPFTSTEGFYRQIGIDIYRWYVGLIGSFAIIIAVKYLIKLVSETNRLVIWVEKVGQHSLQIYLLQRILLENLGYYVAQIIFLNIGYNPLILNIQIYNLLITPLIATSYACIILYIINVFNKLKLSRFLFVR